MAGNPTVVVLGTSGGMGRVAAERVAPWAKSANWPSPTGSGPSAALLHEMQQISGQIEVVHAGQYVSRRSVLTVTLGFPGAGRGGAYTIGHPEPVTLCERMEVRGE